MKFMRILLGFILLSFCSKGQSNHFVYIQTDNKQPFYIKFQDQIISSSDAGYVIIPALPDGAYQLVIGFPKNQAAPIAVPIVIKGNDQGYLIQKNIDNQLELINFQTLEIATPIRDSSSSTIIYETITDEFSSVLAAATNTALTRKQKSIRKETPVTVIPKDTISTKMPIQDSIQNIDQSIVAEIIMLQTSIDSFGRHSTYLINDSNKTDIVSIDIDYPLLDTVSQHLSDTLVIALDSSVQVNQCKIIANQQDVDQLEINMKLLIDEEKMIAVAHNEFQVKCFSTEQVKYLSNLFLIEDNKCSFLLDAYAFTMDVVNFKNLQVLLLTEKNIKRFTETVR